MRTEFVPYNESLELKELGFDELCITSYDTDSKLRNPFDYNNSEYNDILNHQSYFEDAKHFVQNSTINQSSGFIAAPIFSQAFKFFREKYNLEYQIIKSVNGNYSVVIHLNTQEYLNKILTLQNACLDEIVDCYSYEEAELACIKKLINIVKKNKL